MLRKVLIKNLKPNPFRRLGEYPIQRRKVDALKESIEATGFWPNINGRPGPAGTVEIAYGHHRLAALRESYGEDHAVEIVVRDLSNDDMLRMMARENMEEWGSSAWVEMETVRATIEAAARKEITFPREPSKPGRRDVRGLSHGGVTFNYCACDVAIYLGWTRKAHEDDLQPDHKCTIAFLCLDAIRDGLITEDDIRGLSRGDVEHAVRTARKTEKHQREVATEREGIAARMREGAATAEDPARVEADAAALQRNADHIRNTASTKARTVAERGTAAIKLGLGRQAVDEIARAAINPKRPRPRRRQMTTWDNMAVRLTGFLDAVPSTEVRGQLKDLMDNMHDLSEESIAAVRDAGRRMINRCRRAMADFDKAAAVARVATSRRAQPGVQPALPGSTRDDPPAPL
jgi:hypothetical protein